MRTYALCTAAALVILSGLGHGLLSRRWHSNDDVQQAAAKLAKIPMTIGDWDGHTLELGDQEQELGRIVGYVLRRYTQRSTGATVQVLVVCGRPAAIAVHTPDVCYRGAGYEPTTEPAHQNLALAETEGSGQCLTALFRRESATRTEQLRIHWTFTATGTFLAPESPRRTFAGSPALYKIYVVWDVPAGGPAAAEEPQTEFLRLFLANIRSALF